MEEKYVKALNEIKELYENGKRKEAVDVFSTFYKNFEDREKNLRLFCEMLVEPCSSWLKSETSKEALYIRGVCYYVHEKYFLAEADFTKIVSTYPLYPLGYYNRAMIYFLLEKYDDAIKDYDEAVKIDPNNFLHFHNRGNVFHFLNLQDDAIKDYTEALRLNPKDKVSFLNRGICFFIIGNLGNAIHDYSEAIKIDPFYANAYHARGSLYSAEGDRNKAFRDYRKTLKIAPDFSDAHYGVANYYLSKETYDKALYHFQKYLEHTKHSTNNYYHKTATATIEELQILINKPYLQPIARLVSEIKKLLRHKEGDLTHYTSLTVAKSLIIENKPFRLSESSFLNDPTEGTQLLNYLGLKDESITKSGKAHSYINKPFIGSFVLENKKDDLALWRFYGKENKEEAQGCSVTFKMAQFIEAIDKILKDEGNGKSSIRNKLNNTEDLSLYRVAYRVTSTEDEQQFLLLGEERDEEQQKLNRLMRDLKSEISKPTSKKRKEEKIEQLTDILYLFKTVQYQAEYEVRLVVKGVGFNKTIMHSSNIPNVYIELASITPYLTNMVLGPKVANASEWAVAFSYALQNAGRDKEVEISLSTQPYK